jgi:hypothetical protein
MLVNGDWMRSPLEHVFVVEASKRRMDGNLEVFPLMRAIRVVYFRRSLKQAIE